MQNLVRMLNLQYWVPTETSPSLAFWSPFRSKLAPWAELYLVRILGLGFLVPKDV